ncbi:MAG: hypothetical protein FWH43_04980 [Endomicrobia bacterium]|nr:hypothetical protein [Endomicrobiia bacterium]
MRKILIIAILTGLIMFVNLFINKKQISTSVTEAIRKSQSKEQIRTNINLSNIRDPKILTVFDDKIVVSLPSGGSEYYSCIYANDGNYIGETKNNFSPHNPRSLKILGTYDRNIIYTERSNDNDLLYIENIDTGDVKKITIAGNLKFLFHDSRDCLIAGDSIYLKLYNDLYNRDSDVFAKYNFVLNELEYLPIYGHCYYIGIYNNRLYYYYKRDKNIEIYEYDMNTKTSKNIATPAYYHIYSSSSKLLFMKGNFIFIDRQGNPEDVQENREIMSASSHVRIFDVSKDTPYGIYNNNFINYSWRDATFSLIDIDTNKKQELFSLDKGNNSYHGVIGVYNNKIYYYQGKITGATKLPFGAGSIEHANNINIYSYDLATKKTVLIDKNISKGSEYIFWYSNPTLEKNYTLDNRIVYLKNNKIHVKQLDY